MWSYYRRHIDESFSQLVSAESSPKRPKDRVRYLELRGWADECVQRHRTHIIGVADKHAPTSERRESTQLTLYQHIEPFLDTLRDEDWNVLSLPQHYQNSSQDSKLEREISARLFESGIGGRSDHSDQTRSRRSHAAPSHIELTPHHKVNKVSLSSLEGSELVSSIGTHRDRAGVGQLGPESPFSMNSVHIGKNCKMRLYWTPGRSLQDWNRKRKSS